MLTVLRLDPSAYFVSDSTRTFSAWYPHTTSQTYQFQFIDVLMQALVTAKVTIEHEYMSLLLSIDGLRHPLLEDMPCTREEEAVDYKIVKKDFLDKRLSFVQSELFDHHP